MKQYFKLFLFFFAWSCTDTLEPESIIDSQPVLETRAIGDPYHTGLTYSITPSLGTWTGTSTNLTGTCGNSTGGIIVARITSIDGEIAWLEVKRQNNQPFSSSGNVYIKFENICGTVATLSSQTQSFSSYYSNNTTVIRVPFVIIPGVSRVYAQIISSGRYHTLPFTLNASGWMTSSHSSIERSIVNTARQQVGQSSGISTTNSCYLTDMAGNDNQRWINAITVLHNFKLANPNSAPTTQVKTNMKNCFLATYAIENDRVLNVNRIISKYNGTVPTNDNDIMSLIGIRQQCREKQSKFSFVSGGVCKGYTDSGVSDWKLWRPGMALFYKSSSTASWGSLNQDRHAMTLSEIKWLNNTPTFEVKVIESNFGSGYHNPKGSIPWERTVQLRAITINSTKYKVVDQKS